MLRSIKLGKAFGIDLYLHWTFLLLPAFVFLTNVGERHLVQALYLAGFVLVVFGCVLLHELGHALMARRFGIATRDITLYPIGGVARLSRMSEKPWEEFWIAVAGPAVNVAIAAILFAIIMTTGLVVESEKLTGPMTGVTFLVQLLVANVFLVLFNMLPAFPMDGGRVLRALLASRLGLLRGTEVAAAVGMVISALFICLGLASLVLSLFHGATMGSPMLGLVGVFVMFMGQYELAGVRAREAARRRQPRDYRNRSSVASEATDEPLDVLPADNGEMAGVVSDPPRAGFTGHTWDPRTGLWIQWRDGRPVYTFGVESE